MFNKCLLLGSVVDRPIITTLKTGAKVANFTLKTGESWTNSLGEKKERNEYHKIAIFNDRIIDFMLNKVDLGSTVYIEGQMEGKKHIDASGISTHITNIVLRSGRGQLTLMDAKEKELSVEFQ